MLLLNFLLIKRFYHNFFFNKYPLLFGPIHLLGFYTRKSGLFSHGLDSLTFILFDDIGMLSTLLGAFAF